MKIDKIVDYCDKDLRRHAVKDVCSDCNYCTGCLGNIDQVHLSRGMDECQDYNCPYMVEHYVCKYFYAYASEIGDCLNIIRNKILKLEHIHMLSIGFDSPPDLYALWKLKKTLSMIAQYLILVLNMMKDFSVLQELPFTD